MCVCVFVWGGGAGLCAHFGLHLHIHDAYMHTCTRHVHQSITNIQMREAFSPSSAGSGWLTNTLSSWWGGGGNTSNTSSNSSSNPAATALSSEAEGGGEATTAGGEHGDNQNNMGAPVAVPPAAAPPLTTAAVATPAPEGERYVDGREKCFVEFVDSSCALSS